MTDGPALHILLADDEEIVHQTIGDYLRQLGHRVDEVRDGRAAYRAIEAHDYDLALVDVRMPGTDGLTILSEAAHIRPALPVVIVTGHANVEMAVQALRRGAADFLSKPVKLVELDGVLQKSVRLRGLLRERSRLRETIRGLQSSEAWDEANRTVVGSSLAARRARQQIEQAVEADCRTILITGDTGTGKEVVARAIHFQACRETDPLIAVSCAAFPDTLVESELFGHVKGAFTGAAQDRSGYFELAHGGSLFLDEIGDLSPAGQAKLLRVLELRKLRRVGASAEIDVDVRVMVATNISLEQLVETGKFRRDLFYRLNVFTIELSPLRERREDILPLAERFLAQYRARRPAPADGFSPASREALVNYDYPGNVRELRNVIERAAILARRGQIQPEHLNLGERAGHGGVRESVSPDADEERVRIVRALEKAHWNRRHAAEALGMPYSTLRYKLQKLGITK